MDVKQSMEEVANFMQQLNIQKCCIMVGVGWRLGVYRHRFRTTPMKKLSTTLILIFHQNI